MEQIGHLRIRIIGIATAVLAAVIATMIAVASVSDYAMISDTADKLIDVLQSNEWSLPSSGDYDTPETPYETRYFTVTVSDDEKTGTRYDMNRIGSVTTDEATKIAMKALRQGSQRGFVDSFRYRVIGRDSNGDTEIAFLDRGQQLSHLRSFVAMSIASGVMGTLIVAGLTMLFSRSIVAPVKTAYRKQRSFISDAGHELRTPLAAIRADADVAEAELGSSRWIDDIRGQVDRLSTLTDDLICLAKLEESPETSDDVDMSEIIRQSVASIESRAMTRNIRLNAKIDDGAMLLCDRRGAERIASTLTDNAAKYTPEGGKIDITLEVSRRYASFTVENVTAGSMTNDDVSKMFDRFYRLDESRSSKTGGYGMGLSIVKAVCERNGWKRTAYWSPKSQTLTIRIDMPITHKKREDSAGRNR